MGFISTAKLYGIGGILLVLGTFGGWQYFKWSQAKIDELDGQIETMRDGWQSNIETIDALQEELNRFRLNIDSLNRRMSEAEQYAEDLRETLEDSNLTELARERSSLIERRVNDATERVFEDIELITTQ